MVPAEAGFCLTTWTGRSGMWNVPQCASHLQARGAPFSFPSSVSYDCGVPGAGLTRGPTSAGDGPLEEAGAGSHSQSTHTAAGDGDAQAQRSGGDTDSSLHLVKPS